MLQDSANSWKAFSASCWLWKHFSLQIVVEMIEVVPILINKDAFEPSYDDLKFTV